MPSYMLTNAKGYTALMMAAAYNQHPCAAKLLASGANVSARASGKCVSKYMCSVLGVVR